MGGGGGGGGRFYPPLDCLLYKSRYRFSRTTKFREIAQDSMEDKIVNTKMTNFFYPDSPDMTIFGKGPCQKWSNFIYISVTFELIVQNQ